MHESSLTEAFIDLNGPTLLDTGLGLPEEPEIEEELSDWGVFLKNYRYDPVQFCRDVLNTEPFAWQQEAMDKMSGPNPVRRLSICSGHGIGKTACVSMLAVHKLVCAYPVKVIVTAPSAATLDSGLMNEIKIWVRRLPAWLQNLFEIRSDRIFLKSDPEGAFIQARTASADRPESLAGIHADNVLIVCDEASGIPENVYDAAVGSMSSEGSQTVLISNPTRLTGLFYRSQHELRKHEGNEDGVWDTMHVSCLDVPEKVSDEFVREMRASEGEDSPQFRIRVLGLFAATDETSFIPADLVDQAMAREVQIDPMTPLVYGLDVARYGDRSVLCKRKGNFVLGFKVFRGLDLMQLTGAIVNETKLDNPAEILIDAIGMGAGVGDRLRELGFNARDVQVSEAAAMNPQADRLRDDLWLTCREWLNERACYLPPDKVLREELCAPTFKYLSNGKIKIESKDEMRKRIRRSPDLADALNLTFASTMCTVGGRKAIWLPGKSMKRSIKGL